MIKEINAREILDSRGIPTVECTVRLGSGLVATASVPAGASIGKWEALELRDGDEKRYMGKGVLKAVKNINELIAPALIGQAPSMSEIDKTLIALDGTENKSHLGANATLAVSIAVTKAEALSAGTPLYRLIGDICETKEYAIPRVMFNLINGGKHASNNLSFQELLVMPMKEKSFTAIMEDIYLVYYNLQSLLSDAGYSPNIGDEGGFAPLFKGKRGLPEREGLDFLVKAIELSGFNNEDMMICLDVAASHFYNEGGKNYRIDNKTYSTTDMVDLYVELVKQYPIYSIEDALHEEDWFGWSGLTSRLSSQVQIVGDDIFATNPKRIKKGIEKLVASAVVIKPNQIGTVSETLHAIHVCKNADYQTIISHRSGETNDSFISDLVVGAHGGQFKAGACVRGERVAKYNRLLAIDKELRD